MRNRKRRGLAQQAAEATPIVVETAPAPVVEKLTTPVEEEPTKIHKRKSLFSKD